jgi:hypothetical protein
MDYTINRLIADAEVTTVASQFRDLLVKAIEAIWNGAARYGRVERFIS